LALIIVAILLNIFVTKTFITYPTASIINIVLAVGTGVIIWMGGLWSAADAKLFIAFSFLLPAMFFSILVNSFVPLFIFFFFHTMFKTSFKEKKEIAVELAKPKSIFSIFLAILALMSISYVISHVFNISLNYFLTIIIFFLILWLVEQKLKVKLNYFFIAVIILSLVFFHEIILTASFLLNWIVFSCAILLIFFLIYLSRFVYTQSVKLTELKKGMIPAEMIFQRGGRYIKKPIPFLTLLIMLREKSTTKPIFGYNPDGIKDEDIKRVLDLYKGKKLPFNEIKISKTIHFAPFIFLGVLLTYFAQGYFIYLFL
jgi:preflagellin peptidase FlaK